jgi:hypothetical protein
MLIPLLPATLPAVLTKLVRVLSATLTSNGGGQHPTDKHLHEQVLQLLTQSVLPALSLVPGNAGEAGLADFVHIECTVRCAAF